ncbi:MAG: EAL domain-containing protein [Hyphomicrobium sp.]|nr:EAL domain-containing protein [Hyphomicrobium sp.]
MTTETNLQPLAGSVLPGSSPGGSGLTGGGLSDQAVHALPHQALSNQTQTHQTQSGKAKSPQKTARQARDRLVLLSIGLVTAATAAMLFVLFEYSFASSVLIGGGVWSALMTVHLQTQKSAEIARLKSEIQRLEALRGQPSNPGPVATEQTASDGERGQRHVRGLIKGAPQNGPQSNPRWENAQRTGARPTLGNAPRRAPADATPQVVETALWPGTALSAADPMRDQWAFRPRESADGQSMPSQPAFAQDEAAAALPASGPPANIDADLAMVQRKIKALADEVNASDIVRDRAAATSAGQPPKPAASALEASIGELKATAQSMRSSSGRTGAIVRDTPPDQGQLPLPQGQALPFELLIPATAERIAVSQPANAAPTLADPAPQPAAPTLSIAPDVVAASPLQAAAPAVASQSFGLPELPSLDFPQAQLIAAMTAAEPPPRNPRLEAIVDALENGEMDVFLSPIVALQSHQVSHYDVTVRLKASAGGYIDNAEQELQLAGSDLLALFDTARLKRAASLAQRLDAHNKSGSLLSAVNGPSITNAEFLETFARVFEERDRISNQLVLTFTQADLEQFTPSAWQALGDMQAFGFRFALSKIDHVAMDFASLAQRGFACLRLEANALMHGLPARDRFIEADELCRYLAGAGMTLVADTIDDEAIRARVFGFGVLFGQGRLFGGARQVKLDQLPKSAPAAA